MINEYNSITIHNGVEKEVYGIGCDYYDYNYTNRFTVTEIAEQEDGWFVISGNKRREDGSVCPETYPLCKVNPLHVVSVEF